MMKTTSVTAGDTPQNPVGKTSKTMSELSQFSLVAANVKGNSLQFCFTVQMKGQWEESVHGAWLL